MGKGFLRDTAYTVLILAAFSWIMAPYSVRN